jgi:CHASE3 domain sensor protein
MKSMFGLVGILIVLAIVGMLVKPQLQSTNSAVVPAAQQSQQIQQQVLDKVNAAMQAAPKPDDEK